MRPPVSEVLAVEKRHGKRQRVAAYDPKRTFGDPLKSRLLSRFEKKMKKIDLAQTIGILANIGVLAGVLLLVYELAQNEFLQVRSAAELRRMFSARRACRVYGGG